MGFVLHALSALTQTHGCFRASWAVILLAGLIVSIWLIRFLASGVTVSHSGDGNYTNTCINHVLISILCNDYDVTKTV